MQGPFAAAIRPRVATGVVEEDPQRVVAADAFPAAARQWHAWTEGPDDP